VRGLEQRARRMGMVLFRSEPFEAVVVDGAASKGSQRFGMGHLGQGAVQTHAGPMAGSSSISAAESPPPSPASISCCSRWATERTSGSNRRAR